MDPDRAPLITPLPERLLDRSLPAPGLLRQCTLRPRRLGAQRAFHVPGHEPPRAGEDRAYLLSEGQSGQAQ